jgi:predicted nucleotidyltransferase
MLNTLTLNEIITELRQELTKLYGDQLKKLILYGSQARGDANEDSDIDLMIVLTNLTSPGDEIFRMGKIKNQLDLKYDQLISIFPISEKDFSDKKTPLLENIRREGISL